MDAETPAERTAGAQPSDPGPLPSGDGDATPRRRNAADTRARILDAANALFYSHGIRATSADRVIERAGITKVTFYRHFRSKSALVVAYLEQQAESERAWMDATRRAEDPAGSLQDLAAGIGQASCTPGFRGCAFLNAAAEFAEADDPVRIAVDAHRTWMLAQFVEMAEESGADAPEVVGRELMLLRDGAMVAGYLSDPSAVAGVLGAAFADVLAGAGRAPRSDS
jgi:AcrR family transcriptional regulator